MYRAILFDVSDTLIDYQPDYAQIYGDKLRKLGFQVDAQTAGKIRRMVNWEIGQQSLREQNGGFHLTPSESVSNRNRAALSCVNSSPEYEEVYLRKMAEMPEPDQTMRVIPGVFETLNALRDRYNLAIVSNHYSWLAERLQELGLTSYFSKIVISEDVGIEKPDPRIMEIAQRELGVPAAECLYVGDHPMDVLCAKQAGMDCAWICVGWPELPSSIGYKEDYRLNSITELIEILSG